MATRQSPYPNLGADGNVVNQNNYAPPPQPYQMPHSQPYSAQHQQPQSGQPHQQQPYHNAGAGGQTGQSYQPPPPQQQYYQEQQQGYGDNTNGGNGKYSQDYGDKTQKFDAIKPKFNDIFFAIFFVAQMLGFIAVAVLVLRAVNVRADSLGNPGNSITLNLSTSYLLACIAGAGFVFSIILLGIVRAFVQICLLLSVILSVAYAVYLWIEKFWSGAIIFSIFAVISVIAYFPMRKRIPLSKALLLFVLKIASESPVPPTNCVQGIRVLTCPVCAEHHPSVYIIAMVGCLVQAAYSVFWSFVVIATYQKYHPGTAASSTSGGQPSQATMIGLIVFECFNFFWVSQFITNYTLTINAGVYGAVYFGGFDAKSVTWGAFKRASTYSIGSIAFGSLVVALLDLIRAGLSILRSYEEGQGNGIAALIICCVQCCMGCIAGLVEYFNRYAMIEIALYGKAYIQAAKDTWNLFKDRGIDALVNDSLVNSIWTFGSFAVGALCSAAAYLYLTLINPSYVQNNSSVRAAVMGYAFVIGFFICTYLDVVVDPFSHALGYGALSSGVSTIFVGLGEDPEALAERDPALFQTIAQAYPQVTTSV
ncbi:BZ3500_MvSof-1268-A1-R1_Chr2-2g05022 [Microbotryum saponariae]|uniref:Protein PNS1 n=1 Tax=Microbotryum saponariae TaxID=289078 RepID=A0A2X0KAM0_9BASI|nr:BZ3500_MvSof-1268-A1-R1_Chr2-2g05022 [Microbotryum saponariae]SDA00723.1 BZ3501_MvSof-1269-A2-R1_Chr2-2g04696 [Microbotryum saponariae]